MPHGLDIALLICAGLIALGIVTSLLSFRFGAPLLLVFLLLGLIAGQDGVGGINFNDAGLAWTICSIALAVVLFDSGCGTSLTSFRVAARPALMLATLGVLLTTGLLAAFAHYVLDFAWLPALLIAAIVSSTDAAAVFFLLRVGDITVRERVRATLEIESGTNDPMAVFLTLSLVGTATVLGSGDFAATLLLDFGRQMAIGTVAGVAGGWFIALTLGRLPLERSLLPLLALSLALVLFALTNLLGGSGYLAVYAAGLVVGNHRLEGMATMRSFQSAFTWLAQIVMFIALGLLATPSEFLGIAPQALLLSAVLILVARPVAVAVCLAPFGFNWRETAFVSWVGLRGAVSILLAILPMLMGIPEGRAIFNIAFVAVLVSLLVQGWTIAPVASWLGQRLPPRRGPVERVALDLPGLSDFELVCYRIAADSAIARGAKLPRWARPSLIRRGKEALRVAQAGPLRPGDLVYLIVPDDRIELLDRVFAAPRAPAKSDREFYGDFALDPTVTLGDLAASYGIALGERDPRLTLAEVVKREFDGAPTLGDRMNLGGVDLIVREVDAGDRIAEIGLALNPGRERR